MDDSEFDRALIAAAFAMAAERGWGRMNVVQAARQAGLPLDRARTRFPHRGLVLVRFGREADRMALAAASPSAPARDQLFDMLMRRIDALQAHRPGILALFRALPAHPAAALLLTSASLCSMAWILGAAGISTAGPIGKLRAKGLLAVWLWTVRAWRGDESADLAATMAALDQALTRAEAGESWLHQRRAATPADSAAPMDEPAATENSADAPPTPEPPASEPDDNAPHSPDAAPPA